MNDDKEYRPRRRFWPFPKLGSSYAPTSNRVLGITLFLLIFVVSMVAIFQHPRRDPFTPAPDFFDIAGWRYPLEQNSFLRDERLPIFGIFARNSNEVWAVTGRRGGIFHSTDGGASWDCEHGPLANSLFYIEFVNRSYGYAIGNVPIATTNGGITWGNRPLPIMSSESHGSNVEKVTDLTNTFLREIEFRSPPIVRFGEDFGWQVTAHGYAFAESNADTGVEAKDASLLADTKSQSNKANYMLFTKRDELVFFDDGSFKKVDFFRQLPSEVAAFYGPTPEPFLFAQADPTAVYIMAVGYSGNLYISGDVKNWWLKGQIPDFNGANLRYWKQLSLVSTNGAWAITHRNDTYSIVHAPGIYYTDPTNWVTQFTTTNQLYTIHFADTSTGFAAGDGFSVYRTTDGGKHWSLTIRPYRRWPAPWFYVFICITAPILFFLVRPDHWVPSKGIAAKVTGDDPINSAEQDRLQFLPIADGIARFFLNPATVPPLTLAISGKWGYGKSSLMNLIHEILRKSGVRPVRFNAWHNQHEEALFATLMANIIEQGVPEWWNPRHWIFRVRLYWSRIKRLLPQTLVLLMALGFVLGLLFRPINGQPGARLGERFRINLRDTVDGVSLVGDVWRTATKAPTESVTNGTHAEQAQTTKPKVAEKGRLEKLGNLSTGILFAVLAAAFIKRCIENVKAFGVKPGILLAKAAHELKISDLEAKTSFQLRFGREFQEVTEALGANQMVIFIDDLDRCEPSKILEMLEAINFLVSSGKCFVVVSMAREQVEASLSLTFKDIAAEIKLPPERSSSGQGAQITGKQDTEEDERLAYARLYLKKLINMEIVVPSSNRDLVGVITENGKSKDAPTKKTPGWFSMLQKKPSLILYPAITFIMLALLSSAFYAGYKLPAINSNAPAIEPTPKPQATKQIADATKQANLTGSFPQSNYSNGLAFYEQRTNSFQELRKAEDAKPAGAADFASKWLISFCIIGSILLIVWALVIWLAFREERIQFEDSQEFEKALEFWQRELNAWCKNPREIKRYINRVRYVAMRRRSVRPSESAWEIITRRLGELLRILEKMPKPMQQKIEQDDALLVELSIHEVFKKGGWSEYERDGFDDRAKQFNEKFPIPPGSDRSQVEEEYQAISEEVLI